MADQKIPGKVKTEYKVVESRETPGHWRVEVTKPNGESEICSAIFFGPDAKSLAEDYADWRGEFEETEPTESELSISWGAFVERQRIAKYLRDSAEHQDKQGNSDETVALLRAAFDVLTGNHQEPAERSSSPAGTLVPADGSSMEAPPSQDGQSESHQVEDDERVGYRAHRGHKKVSLAHGDQGHQPPLAATTGNPEKR